MALGECFKIDLQKYYLIHFQTSSPTLKEKIKLWLEHFGLHCVAVYRFGQLAKRLAEERRKAAILMIPLHHSLNYLMNFLHHVNIDATVGPGLYIGHVGDIYIGPSSIGENCSVTHNVTIGYGHTSGAEGIPTIGNDVWIGTASVMSGKIQIGNGVTIASGTILTRSVPDNCLVGGNPGRVLLSNYDNSRLLRLPRHPSTHRVSSNLGSTVSAMTDLLAESKE